jgi:hypothetical protein
MHATTKAIRIWSLSNSFTQEERTQGIGGGIYSPQNKNPIV